LVFQIQRSLNGGNLGGDGGTPMEAIRSSRGKEEVKVVLAILKVLMIREKDRKEKKKKKWSWPWS
jgi:hypothetical protein